MSDRHANLLDAGAIAGIGATEFSKESGRSDLRLAVEACEAAIADAGIEPAQVDGMVTFSADTNPEIEIAKNLGVGDLTFFSRIHHGGGVGIGRSINHALAHFGNQLQRPHEQTAQLPTDDTTCAVCALFAGGASALPTDGATLDGSDDSFVPSNDAERSIAPSPPAFYLSRAPPPSLL